MNKPIPIWPVIPTITAFAIATCVMIANNSLSFFILLFSTIKNYFVKIARKLKCLRIISKPKPAVKR